MNILQFGEHVDSLVQDIEVRDKIKRAAEDLAIGVAEELSAHALGLLVDALAKTLLQIFETGEYTGRLTNESMHQVAVILAEVGRARHESNQGAGELPARD